MAWSDDDDDDQFVDDDAALNIDDLSIDNDD